MPSGAPPAPVVVTLPGEIDVTNAGDVEARITAALAAGAGVVIADLTAMTFCDSEGLQHLLRAREKAAGAGAQLRLAITPDTTVARIMELAGINRHIPVYPTVQRAAHGGLPG